MKSRSYKRVLMLLENNPYPQDIRVYAESEALISSGYQVSVICPSAAGQPWREQIGGVYVMRFRPAPSISTVIGYLWEYSYSLLSTFLLSLWICFRPGFDIIHAANPPDTTVFIALFYKLFGKRFIFDHHDLAPELYHARFGEQKRGFLYSTLLGLEALSCRAADHVIATNRSYRESEMQRGHVPPERITIVRNGPDLSQLKAVEPEPGLIRKDAVVIGYAGTIGVQDGVDYLLRAFRCMRELGRTDFYCILVGDGDALPSLRCMVEELDLVDFILFTGWVERADVARYLGAADICVSPEPSNPYNDRSTLIKVMEYMALGKPIVAFDLPETRFTAEGAAVYAVPNLELDLAQKIISLMENPQRAKEMGQIGKERIETMFAWSHQKEYLLAAYGALNKKGSAKYA